MPPSLLAPVARIERLEHQLHRVQILAVASTTIAGALLVSGFAQTAPTVVQAERFELLGAQGARQAILAADSVGFAITLLDRQGRPTGFLRLSDEPRVAVQTGRGKEVAGLGAPQVHLLKE